MGDEILKRDQNSAVVLGGITDDSNEYIRMLRVDPITNRLLVSGTGGGGVTQIIAGTGISISPAGGTGNVTISATGASSSFQKPTSGSLNQGTFVWSTAPNSITVDGQTYQQNQQDGTTMWTGTTTTVLTNIPWPTTSIFSTA